MSQSEVSSSAQPNPLPVGLVVPYAGTHVPTGFLLADGNLIPTGPQYAALQQLLGSRFALPTDPVGACRVPNLSGRVVRGTVGATDIGQTPGSDTQTLQLQHLPQHKHSVMGAWHADGSDTSRLIGGGADIHPTNLESGGGLGTFWEYQGSYTTTEPASAPSSFSIIPSSCVLIYMIKY